MSNNLHNRGEGFLFLPVAFEGQIELEVRSEMSPTLMPRWHIVGEEVM